MIRVEKIAKMKEHRDAAEMLLDAAKTPGTSSVTLALLTEAQAHAALALLYLTDGAAT